MNRRLVGIVGGLFVGATVLSGLETDALACGGCFHPNETPTVVTDHRMIFSVSRDQSTLWDQIEYSGSPSSFGWVLPFAGTIDVGVSSDLLFSVLDQQTATAIYAPAPNCPAAPADCPFYPDGGVSLNAGSGVAVLSREQVGPYDTVQLKADDVNALATWLSQNGFVLPAEVQPIVAEYQAEHFNFLAVKLIPGKDVQDMRPIRVTTKGANVALPLRMVAAGTGNTVGITLWVVGEGKYEPSNFNSFFISTDELVWDWAASKTNYTDLRAAKTAAGNGRIWEMESSIGLDPASIRTFVQNGGGGFPSFPPSTDAGAPGYLATDTKTASEVRDEDLDTLYAGIGQGFERVTRLRADLAHGALDTDLLLKASADQSSLSNVRNITREAGEPLCPVYDGCEQTGQAPRSRAAAQNAANARSGDDDGCSSTSGSGTPTTWLGLGVAALVLVRRRRNR